MNRFIIIIGLIFLTVGCQKLQNPSSSDDFASKLDLIDSDYLIKSIQQKEANTNLYKITGEESDLTPVSFLNSDLIPVDPKYSNITVENYYKLDESLICLTGQFELFNDSSTNDRLILSSIIVDLESNNIYDFKGHFPSSISYYLGSEYIQKDSSNNLYYSSGGKIFKLSKSGLENFSVTQYIPDGQSYSEFFIDKAGNCFYNYDNPRTTKVKLSSGGIYESTEFFQDMFYSNNDLLGIQREKVVRIELGPEVNLEPIGYLYEDIEAFYFKYENQEQQYTILLQNGYNSLNSGYFGIIFFGSTKNVFPLYLDVEENLAGITLWVGGIIGNSLFLSPEDKSAVVKVDLESVGQNTKYILNKSKFISMPDNYDIYSLKILDPNVISFVGLNYDDEKIYTAEIDFDNSIRIISETPSDDFILLDKLF